MSVVGQESVMHQAWNLLMDASARSIAILGPGGIGKTTLMKQLYSKSIATNHFQTVIWITVSSKFTFRKIQDDISKSLGLFDPDWVGKSSEEKSQLIRTEISSKKSVLLLFLDDLWFRIDLETLGVEGSKFIYSTRNAKVPERMGAHSVFKLEELSGENSWQLFQSMIRDDRILKDLSITEIGRKLVSKCEGLPILISTLGAAMSTRKTPKDWESAVGEIEKLRQWKSYDKVISIFKFCFDSLPNPHVRFCLSYFSLFPEDFTILKKDLIDFWICEKLVGTYISRDEALSLGYDAMQTLVRAGFLEEEGNHCVKLLDMIRDFAAEGVAKSRVFRSALLLEQPPPASNRPKLIYRKVMQNFGYMLATVFKYSYDRMHMGRSEIGTALETIGWISSMGDSARNIFADVPTNLFTFLLNHNPFVMIKRKPSTSIYTLTVLDFSNSGVELVLPDVSSLVSLQYLNLSHTWIEELPVELKTLTKLKCLNLEYDDQLRIIPKELISGLSSLRILKMFRCGYSVEEEEGNMLLVRNMDLNPLLSLEHLEVLSITITCVSALHTFFKETKLFDCAESLSLEVFWGLESLDITPLAVMKNLLTLEFHQAECLNEFSLNRPEVLRTGSFQRLREVMFEQCSSLKELTWVILVPNLAILRVKSCDKIQKIISGEWLNKSGAEENLKVFEKLEVLSLDSLAELSSIYKTALPFQCLKKMEITECPLLKKLPLNLNMTKASEVVIEAEEDWWKDVHWENEADKATFLPCFKPLM